MNNVSSSRNNGFQPDSSLRLLTVMAFISVTVLAGGWGIWKWTHPQKDVLLRLAIDKGEANLSTLRQTVKSTEEEWNIVNRSYGKQIAGSDDLYSRWKVLQEKMVSWQPGALNKTLEQVEVTMNTVKVQLEDMGSSSLQTRAEADITSELSSALVDLSNQLGQVKTLYDQVRRLRIDASGYQGGLASITAQQRFLRENQPIIEPEQDKDQGSIHPKEPTPDSMLSAETARLWEKAKTEYITKSDLARLEPKQLTILRNGIFARNGYICKSRTLREYFAQKLGKMATTANDTTVYQKMNKVEQDNVDTIRQFQDNSGKTYRFPDSQ